MPNEITFIVGVDTKWPEPGEVKADDKIYTAVEGMSFDEFINSKYNIDKWYINEHEQIVTQYNSVLRHEAMGAIFPTEVIINNSRYVWGHLL